MAAEELFVRLSSIEVETGALLEEVEGLSGRGGGPEALDKREECTSLAAENAKLNYRIEQLKKCLEAEEMRATRHMTNVKGVVYALLASAVQRVYPEFRIVPSTVQHCGGGKYGDYKCMTAMAITKMLKGNGVTSLPRDVAQDIVAHLQWKEPFLEKCEVSGGGFINVTLQPEFVSELVSQMLVRGVQPPPVSSKRRVVVDFSSPNIAKEMHVGHLRSTIIGETICRLLEFVGHDVLRLNHVGDWGTQFGMLIAHLFDKFPDFKESPPSISDLQQFYKESKKRFDEDKSFQGRAQAYVVKLQNYDDEVVRAWKLIADITRTENDKIYKRLNVTCLERGESFYQPMLQTLVDDLKVRGHARVEEGRTIVFADGISVPLTIQKANGAFTYDTTDLAALKHRVQEEKGDWLIYVVDSGQALHFRTVFSVGRRAGYYSESTRIDHVGFGVVLGEDKKKFKSRDGNTVRLVDLLDEGIQRARQRLLDNNRHKVLSEEELKASQLSVAYGCVKYADLAQTRTNDYIFSFDKMLEDKGNTAAYLLYAYTRIRSIARVANVSVQQLKEAALTTTIDVSHEKELKLCKCIVRFPEVIDRVMEDLYPHVLCEYLYDLCTTFTEFYDACYCVEKDRVTGKILHINMSRLLLCEATAQVMDKAFYILGLEPLSKM